MNKYIRIKQQSGYTLLESILALSIVSGGVFYAVDYTKKSLEEASYKQHSALPLQIIKATDRRIEIDGYNQELWSTLPLSTNTEEVINYSKNAFIAKGNLECGLATGWVPQLEESEKEALIPCNFGEDNYKKYDYQLITTTNTENALSSLNVIMRLKSKYEIREDNLFLNHKGLLNKIKANQPNLKVGNFSAEFSNFNDLTQTLSSQECAALENNCVIRASWKSDGYNESLRLDGTNNMVNTQITFVPDNLSDTRKCVMWEYDNNNGTTPQYSMVSSDVECGIGIYNKTLNPIVATIDVKTVDAVVDSVTSKKAIILNQECFIYRRDSDGFLIPVDTSDGSSAEKTECGIIQDENLDPEGDSTKVIQVVNTLNVDDDYSTTDSSFIVNDLIAETARTVKMEIFEKLVVHGQTNLNTLVVKENSDGSRAQSEFTNIVYMSILNVTSKSNFNNVDISKPSDTYTDPILKITKDLDIDIDNTNNNENLMNQNVTTVEETKAGHLQLRNEKGLTNGNFCDSSEVQEIIFDGKDVLTCRLFEKADNPDNNKYKWLSNRLGEIVPFELGYDISGNKIGCPTGWTEFDLSEGRALLGDGWVFDPLTPNGSVKYEVGNTGGEANVKLTVDTMPGHQHEYTDVYYSERWGPLGPGTQAGHGNTDNDNNFYYKTSDTEMAGNDIPHDNMTPHYNVTYCKYQDGDKKSIDFTEPSQNPDDYWYPYSDLIGNWFDVGSGKNCSDDTYYDYRPEDREYWHRICEQDQMKYEKEREINYITGEVRETGVIKEKTKMIDNPEIWVRGTNVYESWYDISEPYNCSSSTTSVNETTNSYIVKLSCSVERERTYQERIMIESTDSNGVTTAYRYRNWDEPKSERGTFIDIYPFTVYKTDTYMVCSDWETSTVENAKLWTPDAALVDRGTPVYQTRTVTQTRNCEHYAEIQNIDYLVDTSVESRQQPQSRTITGGKVNLNEWRTYDSNGNWSVQDGGSYVYQGKNGEATIFESSASDYGSGIGSVIRGQIKVRSGQGDDDWIGFVMGKKDTNNFYLWSWKKNDQNIYNQISQMGHVFAKVTNRSSLSSGTHNGWNMHESHSGYTMLEKHTTGSLSAGWVAGTVYTFRIEYKPDSVSLFISSDKSSVEQLLFDVQGTFTQGSVGFFNKSQDGVEYFNVSEEPYYE